MLPRTRAPAWPWNDLLFRRHCTKLSESVEKLSATLSNLSLPRRLAEKAKACALAEFSVINERKAKAERGKGVSQAIVALINAMSSIVGRLPQKTGQHMRKRLRLPVTELLANRSKDILRETIRASRKEEPVEERIHAYNLLSATASLNDVDSSLELAEFVTDYILAGAPPPRPKETKNRLAQKALALLVM